MANADTNKKEKLATELVLSGPDWFPLGGQDAPDPLRLVLGQLPALPPHQHALAPAGAPPARRADGEQALGQVVARPATAREQRRLLAAGKRIRTGQPTSRLLRVLEFLLPGPRQQRRTQLDPTVSPDGRAVLEKASHPLFRSLIRLSVSGPDKRVARGRMHALTGAFAA